MNFEIFDIPYIMHLGIASLLTVHLVKRVGHGWCCGCCVQ